MSESYSIQLTSAPEDPDQVADLIARTFGVDRQAVLVAIESLPATIFHGLTETEFERVKAGLVQLSRHGLNFRRTSALSTRMGKALMLPVTLRDGVAVKEEELPVLKPSGPAEPPPRAARPAEKATTRRGPRPASGTRPSRHGTRRGKVGRDAAPTKRMAPRTRAGDAAPAPAGRSPGDAPETPPVLKPASRPDKETPPVLKPASRPDKETPPVLKPVAPATPSGQEAPPVLKPVAPAPPPGQEAPPVLKPASPASQPGRQSPPVLKPVAASAPPGTQPPQPARRPQGAPGKDAPPVLQPVARGGTPGGAVPVLQPTTPAARGSAPAAHVVTRDEMVPVRVLPPPGLAFRLRVYPLPPERREVALRTLAGVAEVRPPGLEALQRGDTADVLMAVPHQLAARILDQLLEEEIPACVARLS